MPRHLLGFDKSPGFGRSLRRSPSVVAVTANGKRVVGQIASRQAITNPEHTIHAAKRLIGRKFDDEAVQSTMQHVSYQIAPGPYGDVRVVLRGKQYSIPEISAILLQEMRVVAEEHLGHEVERAVVTVPAYFNDNQRQAVRDAGLIAGLQVLRIINEPTAAAIAYGFHRNTDKVIAVYDMGGGTFDVSIVKVTRNGTFSVLSTTGDSFLGGEDFDERIMAWLIRGFEVQRKVDLRRSPIALQRLKQAAQKAKCELSTLDRTEIRLPFIVSSGPTGPLNMHYAITRPQFEKLTADLVKRSLVICQKAIAAAKLTVDDVDEVILVGGMTRMPAVQAQVEDFFKRKPCKGVHPDEVVALGAAIQGSALADEIEAIDLEDVTAHSLGIATAGDHFDVIIPANTGVPVRVPSLFTTHRDNQDALKIVVLQGESEKASENTLLQDFFVRGLREAKAGEVEVEVAFTIDDDGIFSVSAKDLETGEETRIEVNADSGLDAEEIQQMADESSAFLEERRAEEAAERLRQGVEALVAEVERLSEQAEEVAADDPMAALTISHAENAAAQAKRALEENSRSSLAEHLVMLEDAKAMIEKIVHRGAN